MAAAGSRKAAISRDASPTPNANASPGAFHALHDCTAIDGPDRWLTCNMEYGNFYKISRPSSAAAVRRQELLQQKQRQQQQQQRPQSVPNLKLESLHEKCENKWELLSRQLEECRGELEQLRLQRRDQKSGGIPKVSPRSNKTTPRSNKSSPRSNKTSPRSNKGYRCDCDDDESPLTTSRCGHDHSSPGQSSCGDRESHWSCQKLYEGKVYVGKKDDTGRRSPAHKVFNICIKRTPSPSRDDEESECAYEEYENNHRRYGDRRGRYDDTKCGHEHNYHFDDLPDEQCQHEHGYDDDDDDYDEKCDNCKMLERPGSLQSQLDEVIPPPRPRRVKKKWRKQRRDKDVASESSIHPATSKYNYYKYYGFAGHGAKTSWGHNYPLGIVPPYSVKAPAEM